jgi:hypothetical protein
MSPGLRTTVWNSKNSKLQEGKMAAFFAKGPPPHPTMAAPGNTAAMWVRNVHFRRKYVEIHRKMLSLLRLSRCCSLMASTKFATFSNFEARTTVYVRYSIFTSRSVYDEKNAESAWKTQAICPHSIDQCETTYVLIIAKRKGLLF